MCDPAKHHSVLNYSDLYLKNGVEPEPIYNQTRLTPLVAKLLKGWLKFQIHI